MQSLISLSFYSRKKNKSTAHAPVIRGLIALVLMKSYKYSVLLSKASSLNKLRNVKVEIIPNEKSICGFTFSFSLNKNKNSISTEKNWVFIRKFSVSACIPRSNIIQFLCSTLSAWQKSMC